ncbi:MAG: cytoplasmic protein [Phycisphaerae bacterium]|nr:cytoplasmic protein [Phycisphaerae bacterium]
MAQEFVSEPITPVVATADAGGMTRGEPGLPGRFRWRHREFAVSEVLKVWKEDGPCRSGGNEKYLRKHWYTIRVDDGSEMTIYFDRQARSASQAKRRWWLYTVNDSGHA